MRRQASPFPHACVFALAIGLACAATLVVGVLLTFSSVAERADRSFDHYDALLDTVAQVHIQEQIRSVERELRVIEATLDRRAIRAGHSVLTDIWPWVQGFQQNDHHVFFYNALHRRIDTYPAFVPDRSFVAEQRPWFKAVDGTPARWTAPYREFSSGRPVVSLVKPVRSERGELLGVLGVDLSLGALEKTLEQAAGRNPVVIQVRTVDGHAVLAQTRPLSATQIARAAEPGDTLGALRHGALRRQVLADPGWEVLFYVPPEEMVALLVAALKRHLMPMLALLASLMFAFGLLARLFWRERQVLADALDAMHQGRHPESELRQQRLWLMGEQLGAMNRLAQLVGDVRHHARHDALTGIPNRRAFEQDLDAAIASGEGVSLLSFDIDRFKPINDSHGHNVGDAVLRRVSATLTAQHLPLTLYRIGGDEFAALVDPAVELEPLCETILAAVRALAWREAGIHVTLSLGAASTSETRRRDELLALADARLYRSKQAGRDRATLSGGALKAGPARPATMPPQI